MRFMRLHVYVLPNTKIQVVTGLDLVDQQGFQPPSVLALNANFTITMVSADSSLDRIYGKLLAKTQYRITAGVIDPCPENAVLGGVFDLKRTQC